MRSLLAVSVAATLLLAPAVAIPIPAVAAPAPVGGTALGRTGLVLPAGAPRLPAGIDAASWLVADAGSGAVLGAFNPHARHLPASTLKTLTAVSLLPVLTDRDRLVTASTAATTVDGTRVGLVTGGRYPVRTLFECMLMMSGNDCAMALAQAAGGIPATVSRMNATAGRLGARDTHAGTPSGLDAAGEHSSAYDLALILRAGLRTPDFVRYNSVLTAPLPTVGRYRGYTFYNKNLLRLNHYPGVIASKNGYTDAARQTFVAAVDRGGRTLIVTLMRGERHPVEMYVQAERLLAWGFAVDGRVRPVGTLVGPGTDRTDAGATAAKSRTATGRSSTPSTAADSRAAATSGRGSGQTLASALGVAGVVIVVALWAGWMVRRRRGGGRDRPPEA